MIAGSNRERQGGKMRRELQVAIKAARQELANKGYQDTNLAVFMIRDFKEVREAGLSDLAWSMYREYCTVEEVKWLLDELEKRLEP